MTWLKCKLPSLTQIHNRLTIRPKKRFFLFPVTVRKKKGEGRSVKKIFLHYFLVKNVCFMHVLQ